MDLQVFDNVVNRLKHRPVYTLIGILTVGVILTGGAFLTAYFQEKGKQAAMVRGPSLVDEKTVPTSMEDLEGRSEIVVSSRQSSMNLAAIDNHLYQVFIQYYPSTDNLAQNVRHVLEESQFTVVHFRELREGQLSPRRREIIYYSDPSKTKSKEVSRLLSEWIGVQIPLAESPYFGDGGSKYKIFINLLGPETHEIIEPGAYLKQKVSDGQRITRSMVEVRGDIKTVKDRRPTRPEHVIGFCTVGSLPKDTRLTLGNIGRCGD